MKLFINSNCRSRKAYSRMFWYCRIFQQTQVRKNVLSPLLHLSILIAMSTTWSVIQCQTTLSTFRRKKGSMKLKTRLFDYWGNENWYWQHETKCDKNEGYIHWSKISVQLVSIATTFFYTVLYSIRMRFSWSKIWVIVQHSSSNTSGVIMGKNNVNVNTSYHHIG